jgi:hypothetical protein
VELFVGEKCSDKFHLEFDFHVIHGTDGFTFPPKEGVLRIRWFRPGLNPLTSRPPKWYILHHMYSLNIDLVPGTSVHLIRLSRTRYNTISGITRIIPRRPWNCILISDWGTFASYQRPHWPWSPFSRLCKGKLGFFSITKRPGREATRWPVGVEIKNAWSYTCSSPCVKMVWRLITHKDNRFKASAAVNIRSSLFKDIRQRRLVVGYWRFVTNCYRSHLQRSSCLTFESVIARLSRNFCS